MQEQLFGNTHTGRVRTNNEDTFIAQSLDGQRHLIACVIDGVGGYEGGEVAAATARDTVLAFLQQNKGNPLPLMQQAIRQANAAIWSIKEEKKEWQQMACVLTLALVNETENIFYYAHVGDTRLYLFRDRSLVKITKDQSFVGFLEDSGRLSEQDAMNHPKRNEINKALGFERDLRMEDMDTGSSPFLPGDQLLLCSDGLTDMIPSEQIVSILQQHLSLPDVVNQLIDAANEAGGKDNITAVVVRNRQAPAVQVPVVPAKTWEQPPAPPAPNPKEKKSRKGPKRLWLLLPVLALLMVAWLVLREKKEGEKNIPSAQSMAALMLQERLQQRGGTIILSDSVYGKRIAVADTITVIKDSLHLDGSGIILINNESFPGPALQIKGTSHCILENLVFENFSTAVVVVKGTVELRNVQFRNCGVGVAYLFEPPGSGPMSGILEHTIRIDSASTSKPDTTR